MAAVLGGDPALERDRERPCARPGAARSDALPAPSRSSEPGAADAPAESAAGGGMLPRTRPWGCASELQNLERVKEKIEKKTKKTNHG